MTSSTKETVVPRGRQTRPREEKYDTRRAQLAESALKTLGELGYARTTLRDIAQNSEFSHGVVHYYFANKDELIVHCVRHYKKTCVHRYDDVVELSETPEEMVERFADKLVETLREEAPMHRLWYDLRTQGMFDEELRVDVLQIDQGLEDMVWRVVCRYAELSGLAPAFDPPLCYALLDGVFEKAVLDYLARGEPALDDLRVRALVVLRVMFA